MTVLQFFAKPFYLGHDANNQSTLFGRYVLYTLPDPSDHFFKYGSDRLPH